MCGRASLSTTLQRSLLLSTFKCKQLKFRPDDFILHNKGHTTKLLLPNSLFGSPASCLNLVRWFSYSNSNNRQYNEKDMSQIRQKSVKQDEPPPPPPPKQLCFENYDTIGFDLDCTLMRYNLNEMMPMEYDVLQKFLVEQKGYPRKLLKKKLDFDFLQKGLIIDAEKGNILKLCLNGSILRATHGTRLLDDKEIEEVYGPERKWEVSTQFIKDPISTWNGPASKQLRALLDYFDMPAGMIFAQAVDLVDEENAAKEAALAALRPPPPPPPPTPRKSKKASTVQAPPPPPPKPPKPYKVWDDVQAGLMHMYSRENFANGTSAYFNAMREQPHRYVLRVSDRLLQWLCELRASGKKLFLLTGSHIDFANNNARYAFGADYQTLFDVVICYAKKPGFFFEKRPFICVNMQDLTEVPDSELDLEADFPMGGKVYSQGNWPQLRATLSKILGKDSTSTRALYLGDNLIQDIYAPVKYGDFHTVAISEELLANDVKDCEYEYAHLVASKFWGSYFSLNGTPTLWSSVIGKYSQICVPMVEDIIGMPLCKTIRCMNVNGFYPKQPKELDSVDLRINNEVNKTS